jgi:hypothetical protein
VAAARTQCLSVHSPPARWTHGIPATDTAPDSPFPVFLILAAATYTVHERYSGLYAILRVVKCFETVARKYDFVSTPKAWIGLRQETGRQSDERKSVAKAPIKRSRLVGPKPGRTRRAEAVK